MNETISNLQVALEIMRHALGLNYTPSHDRNYYCTGKSDKDYPVIAQLVELGLMTEGRKVGFLSESESYFFVTQQGKEFVNRHQSHTPKVGRSKLRYEAYLRADSGEKFGDWLKNPYWNSYRQSRGC